MRGSRSAAVAGAGSGVERDGLGVVRLRTAARPDRRAGPGGSRWNRCRDRAGRGGGAPAPGRCDAEAVNSGSAAQRIGCSAQSVGGEDNGFTTEARKHGEEVA